VETLGATCLSGRKREDNWGKKKIAIISANEHTKLKITVFMLLGGPQNTIKSQLVFTALFCFAPFSVFSSRMSALNSDDDYLCRFDGVVILRVAPRRPRLDPEVPAAVAKAATDLKKKRLWFQNVHRNAEDSCHEPKR
jgi:hypothetical protein